MSPLLLVLAISVVIGLVMVVVFRYTSDQKAIGQAKDQLKAHLLAVRLFQDQLPVVIRAYGRIFRGTGRYLRLAFMPFLISLLPITFLIISLTAIWDRPASIRRNRSWWKCAPIMLMRPTLFSCNCRRGWRNPRLRCTF